MTEPTNTQVEPIVPSEKTYTQAELDAIIAEKIEKELAGIKANRDALLEEKKEQQRLAQEAELEKKRLAEEAARKNGDLEAIENSWREKLNNTEQELKSKYDSAQKRIHELTVGRTAQELAGKLAKPHAQRLLAKEINERLTLDENGNVRVLDAQGKPSALTIAELETELRNDVTYQDIILINNSSGGGATGGGFGGGAAKKPSEYTAEERVELLNTNPALFKQLFK